MSKVPLYLLVLLFVCSCSTNKIVEDKKVDNLTAFTKLYGYVKHFYPSDEAQDIDWDSFAVYGSQYVMPARNNEELSELLRDLFLPIVPDLILYTQTKPELNLDDVLPGRKTTFWQYDGYNNTNSPSVYRSIRTNRPIKIDKTTAKEPIWTILYPQMSNDVDSDTRIRVSFKIWKAESDSLTPGIYVRFGGDYVGDELSQSGWSEKSYELEVKSDQINALAVIFDNLEHLSLDDFLVEEWHKETWHRVFFSDFSQDEIGNLPNNFIINTTPHYGTISRNVDVLIENNMDNKRMSIQKTNSAENYTLGFIDKIFSEELLYGQVLDKELIPGLNCYFPMVLQCDMKHTYPIADKTKLDELKQKYSVYDMHNREEQGVWFAGIIKYWNEMNFFYPYFEYNICDWDKELSLCLERTLESKNFSEYRQALRLLMSKTEDGHAFLGDNSLNTKLPPFNTYPINGKWLVTSVLDDSLASLLGNEVVKMNGESFSKLMQENRPYYISSNSETTNLRLFRNFMRTYQDSVAIFKFKSTSEKSEYEYTKEIPLAKYNPMNLLTKPEKVIHYPNEIVYINANIMNDAELDEVMPDLLKAKGIILDLRLYPRISPKLLSNLLTEADSLTGSVKKRYIQPKEELLRLNEDKLIWALQPAEPHIGAKIIALCGRSSQSYCEAYLLVLKHNKLATLVGQPTAGANGNVIQTYLPGDIKVNWTGMLKRNPDKSRFFGVGLIPDVIVEKTVDDIQNGRDPELEKALELLSLDQE